MNVCKEISCSLKKQSVLILEKSAVQNNIQESDPQKCVPEDEVDDFMLNKGHQTIREKMLFPGEKCFGLGNPYFEFCLKPNDSNNVSHLETTINSEKVYKGNYSSCKEEEGKQSMPLRIIKNQSDFFEASLPDGIENKAINICEESNKLTEKNQQETIQLMKSTDEITAPKKRRHEDGEADSSMLEECVATRKKILFKTEKELCMGNPYLEFILKSEDSNSHLCVTGNSEELYTCSIASGRERKMDDKGTRRNKNGSDIFGNRLTSKDQNKFKVICPHCTKKVPAPGFVRHLSYCMRVSIRKSTRRS
ncbi:hypothetical protein AVEN_49396-1 [Araneus ventricosus]|uniref:SAGA-associated factor 11 n=1 Tax=Araneus ventricosus TaxID=182803 RepID=A0A4Y2CQ21_ARAVE|nr:hypothetical protein AVEN_49396-1 [Araneus ventricosus]